LPSVLYPVINMKTFVKSKDFDGDISKLLGREVAPDAKIFTSLNRYERKKNIGLAIESFAIFLAKCMTSGNRELLMRQHLLVVAGGWDPRVAENVEHDIELQKQAMQLGVQDKIIFLKSISNDQRLLLLEKTEMLLYTPENEHFGIVPVEAMHMGCIVMACDSGGPLESIVHNVTGFLFTPNANIGGN